jgi:tetratricopeptide (TPR) repeat protein
MLVSSRSFRLTLLALLAGLLLSGPARAAGDDSEPYKLRIVLHLAPNRLLTDVFRRQLERELKDGIQAALGKLAEVEVTSKPKGPRLAAKLDEVLARGLQRALDGWRERSAYKTHFVLIDFAGTRYQIQARQHDGLTGLPSPTVRREQTRDRAYVARTVALLISHDLGLVGTVVSEPDSAGRVRVELKGGQLAPLDRWFKKDEVLRLVRVVGDGAGQQVPWTFLQVETPAKDGVCTCRLYRRYPSLRVRGLRCVLLGTRSGSLRLRVVQEKRGGRGYQAPESTLTLQIRRRGFEGENSSLLQVVPRVGGDVDTSPFGAKGRFDRLAFITVMAGATRKARIPVALIDERPILLPVPAVSEETTLAQERFRLLQRSVLLAYFVQVDLVEDINKLTTRPGKVAEALATVKLALERAREDHARLSKERDEVEKEVAKVGERRSFDDIDKRLRMIRDGERDLMNHINVLEKIEKEEENPKRKEWLIQREVARAFEKEADLEQAIAIYEKAPDEYKKEVEKALASLKARWKGIPRDARDFIYKTWPKLDTPGMAEKIGEAEKAFEACKKASDRVGPFKLLRGNEKHVERLAKEEAELKPDINIDDARPAQVIAELVPKLRKLNDAIRAYLDAKAGD